MRKSTPAGQRDESILGETARWVLMLPLATLFAAIAYGVIAIGLTTIGYALLGPSIDSVPFVAAGASTVASAVMAYVFVWAAVVVAPSRRVRVAQALIGIGSAVAATVMYDAAIASSASGQLATHGSLASSAGFIAGLIAAGFSLRHLRA